MKLQNMLEKVLKIDTDSLLKREKEPREEKRQEVKKMKAMVYRDGTLHFEDRAVPEIQEPQDALVKVTLSAICRSDLHILHQAVPRAENDIVLGHEFTGEVIEVGERVTNLKPGDRVAANCITFCGECENCRRGFINNCEKGGWELGCRIDGCQAEYVRVPFAEQGLTRLPDSVSDENALFVGDILSSGYFGAELCGFHPGDTAVVIGAGPVGLCSMMCARLFGVSRVIAIDKNEERLKLAKERGLADDVLNPQYDDVIKRVFVMTNGRGADGVIEAAGGADTFEMAWKSARANRVVALIAMYEENQILPLPAMYGKNLIFKTGGVDAVHCERLVHLIEAGQLNTDFLITHRVSLNEIENGYRIFEETQDGCLKLAVTPLQV